jgi:putative ABC transport system permease protein
MINIAGLSVGMACTILIFLWVNYELSFDRFHKKAERIYRVEMNLDIGELSGRLPTTGFAMGPTLQAVYPEVIEALRFRNYTYRTLAEYLEKKIYVKDISYADNSVFSIFTFPLIKGDSRSALKNARAAVVTEDLASSLFGDEDPVGKVVKLNNLHNFTITGVMKNVPPNSHLMFNMLLSFESLRLDPHLGELMETWDTEMDNYTYVLLHKNSDVKELEKKIPVLIETHIGETLKALDAKMEYFLQPLTSIHLHSTVKLSGSEQKNIYYVYIFSAIAVFILVIACMNFMNLSTSRSANRAKEVGVRKALGAYRRNLVHQFLGESLILSFASLIIAICLVEISLPFFRNLSGRALVFDFMNAPRLAMGLIGLVINVGFLAGSYPAFFLSSFQPIQTLKGSLKTGVSGSRFRSIFVIVQFGISIFMIIGTGIIHSQLTYMQHKDLGFDKDRIAVLQIVDRSILSSIDQIKQELKSYSGISAVAFSSRPPGHGKQIIAMQPEGFSLDQAEVMGIIGVDADFISTMGIELVTGRNFSSDLATDRTESIMINETAARQLGWTNPIGKTIHNLAWQNKKTIIGVIRDFHTDSLHFKISSLYIENDATRFNTILIKIKPGAVSDTMKFLEKKWKEIDPTHTFDFYFLDESFDGKYNVEIKLSKVFSIFTFFAIFIACLGLFGLASFTAERRTKEIGIRKALGASLSGIILLLTREFTKWLIVANIIAWPIAYLAMNHWLQNFAYRIDIGLGLFILAAILALTIALLTICYQAVKAAWGNPVNALRYE